MINNIGVSLILGFVATGMIVSSASATNITIFDKQSKADYFHTGVGVGAEDQEIEPASQPGQQWDLEGIIEDGSTLSIVGGYDFANGTGGYMPGDMFIDVNGDAVWGTKVSANGSQYGTSPNSLYHYDYVVNFDPNGTGNYLEYEILSLTDATLLDVKYTQNDYSNPWRYDSGGVDLGITGLATMVTGLTDADTGFLGGSHNMLTVDLSGLFGAAVPGGTLFHYTYQCGNDMIIGRTVPDNGLTLSLLGGSLLGLLLLSRRLSHKKTA